MDCHPGWIYASAHLSQEGIDPSAKHPNPCKLVSGNQEDMDLIVAFDAGETTHLIMLEAKAETAWSNNQMDSKAKRLKAIFGEQGDRFPHLCPHLGLMSPRPPRQLKTGNWPSWMLSTAGAPICMKLTVPPGRKKLTRRDMQNKNGGYFIIVESTGKK